MASGPKTAEELLTSLSAQQNLSLPQSVAQSYSNQTSQVQHMAESSAAPSSGGATPIDTSVPNQPAPPVSVQIRGVQSQVPSPMMGTMSSPTMQLHSEMPTPMQGPQAEHPAPPQQPHPLPPQFPNMNMPVARQTLFMSSPAMSQQSAINPHVPAPQPQPQPLPPQRRHYEDPVLLEMLDDGEIIEATLPSSSEASMSVNTPTPINNIVRQARVSYSVPPPSQMPSQQPTTFPISAERQPPLESSDLPVNLISQNSSRSSSIASVHNTAPPMVNGPPAPVVNWPFHAGNQAQAVPKPAVKYRMDLNSGFVSPLSKINRHPVFIRDCNTLLDDMARAKSNVVRRCVRELWQKSLVGSDYHKAFVLNVTLNESSGDFVKTSFAKFGKKAVRACPEEILEHWDPEIIECLAPKLVEKMPERMINAIGMKYLQKNQGANLSRIVSQFLAQITAPILDNIIRTHMDILSPELMNEIMAKRLQSIESRDLLNMLARAERLGYTMADVLEDYEEEDAGSDIDFGVDIITTDLRPTDAVSPPVPAEVEPPSPTIFVREEPDNFNASRGSRRFGKRDLAKLDVVKVKYPQSQKTKAMFDLDLKCQFCQAHFPSQEVFELHKSKQYCLREPFNNKSFGCVFCGRAFTAAIGIKLHAEKHICGDWSKFGQTRNSPNGPDIPARFHPPLALLSMDFPENNLAELPARRASLRKHSLASIPIYDKSGVSATPGSSGSSVKRKSLGKTPMTPFKGKIERPSDEFIKEHGGDPTAHLTNSQYAQLSAEIAEVEERYQPRIAKYEALRDIEKAKRLKNCLASARSMIRAKFGVRLPKGGGPYSNLRRNTVLGPSFQSTPLKRNLDKTGTKRARESDSEDVEKRERMAKMRCAAIEKIGDSGLLGDGNMGAAEVDPTRGDSAEAEAEAEGETSFLTGSQVDRSEYVEIPDEELAGGTSEEGYARGNMEETVYVSSGTDDELDDDIPARLPGPRQ